ncbi:MAG: archaemetzincin family Zn-dependent metalloprotease [Thaumarchaeota archaeon]|nr:archaemetzincin family Zn-dependent metalloprotease [Candidatus Calditenuaceae archaeon]MDW8041428.1 archaemetzincin family Zn-dependent metalloprotease [Nitrososphaerota archaeon]
MRGRVLVVVDERVEGEALSAVSVVEEVYGLPLRVERSDLADHIAASTNRRRGQVDALQLLKRTESMVPERGFLLILVLSDIFVDGFNFCFGLAYRRSAVVSTFRLRHPDPRMFVERVRKEIAHELGHLLGLRHCPRRECVMYFSNSIEDTDEKGVAPCDRCRTLILG